MIISIDGMKGSGKTSIARFLADSLDGVYVKYDSERTDPKDTPLWELTKTFDTYWKTLDACFTKTFDETYRGRVFFIFNLMRSLMIRASERSQKSPYIFIDTYWDPLWMMDPKDMPEFYKAHTLFLPAPDISFFIEIEPLRARDRVRYRDLDIDHDVDVAEISQQIETFTRWAKQSIPNFHILPNMRNLVETSEHAMKIIKTTSVTESPVSSEASRASAAVEHPKTRILSLRQRSLQRRKRR